MYIVIAKKIFFIFIYFYTGVRKRKKSAKKRTFSQSVILLLGSSLCCEALAAVNRLTFGGLEGNLAILTALYTNSSEHLSRALLCILSCGTAVLASGGLVLKASGCIEFLLTCGEHEIIATFFALQCLVLVHVFFLPHLNGF